MKKSHAIITGILSMMAMSAQAAFVLASPGIYRETFDNNTDPLNDAPLGTVGWKASWGANAAAYNVDAALSVPIENAHLLVPVLSGASMLFNNVTNSHNQRTFHYYDGGSFGSAADFQMLRFDIRNQVATENLQAAIQIDGVWFVSNNVYNNASAGTWATVSTSGTAWSYLDFTSGFELVLGSSAVLPTTGDVTGVGFYDASRTDRIRIDNVEIHFVPEPASALLIGAGLSLSFLRRRR